MNIDVGGIIVLVTFFIVFGIFLFYDFFRKRERWGYLSYIVAVIPINILWYYGYDVLGSYMVLFILWDICLIRDFLLVYRRDKEYDDIFLFLLMGIVIQLILTGTLPAMNPLMQINTFKLWFFYFPNVYGPDNSVIYPNLSILLGFRIAATVMVILVILPMLLDLKYSEEHISLIALIVIDLIFILPFLWLGYVWLGGIGWPLTLLFAVLLLIVLLLLTKEK